MTIDIYDDPAPPGGRSPRKLGRTPKLVIAGLVATVVGGALVGGGFLSDDNARSAPPAIDEAASTVVLTVVPTTSVHDKFAQLLPDLRARAFFEMVPPTDGRSVVALTAQQIDAIKGGFKFSYQTEGGIAILDTADGTVGVAESLGRPDVNLPPIGEERVLPSVLVSPDGTYSVIPGVGVRPPTLYNAITGDTRNLDPRVGITSAVWSPDSTMLAIIDTRFDRILIEFVDGSMGVVALDYLGVKPLADTGLVIYR